MKPHKHYQVIMAWARGAKIQVRDYDNTWKNWNLDASPPWDERFEYRIKPEPIDIDYKMKNMKEEALKIANELAFQPSELSMWDRNIAANMIHDLLEELEHTKQKYKSMHNLATQSMSQVHQLEKDKNKEYNSITIKPLSDGEIKDIYETLPPSLSKPELLMLFARAIEKEIVNKNAHNIKQDDEMSINMSINNDSVNKND
jgi:hypothetical protein